jgi:hypothetical protein
MTLLFGTLQAQSNMPLMDLNVFSLGVGSQKALKIKPSRAAQNLER